MPRMIFHHGKDADETAQIFFDNHYHDRGKMKWGGFLLSEHTADITKTRAREEKLAE